MQAIREIWLGPLLGEQRETLIERCRERLREGRGEEILYIAASRSLMLEVFDRMVDGVSIKGNAGALPIHLFNGLIRQILKSASVVGDEEDLPLPRRDRIDVDARPLQRPLLAQVMSQLALAGRIPRFGSLGRSEGCVESVADLIGEIQRAGKSAEEFQRIVTERVVKALESLPRPPKGEWRTESGELMSDVLDRLPDEIEGVFGYERDVALIYACYQAALRANALTEINEDHLRVLDVLDGFCEGHACRVPYIEPVKLLIVDGFFDFTPAQGEILKRLIRRVPEVVFNFDYDLHNRDVFRPIDDTIEHVEKMADTFVRVEFHDIEPTARKAALRESDPGLTPLRQGLFNTQWTTPDAPPDPTAAAPVLLLRAPDPERELRAIAKEIKQLVQSDGFRPDEIAIVVREKSSYGEDLRRVLGEEDIAYSLDERLKVGDVPAVRAVRKVLEAAAARRPEDVPDNPPHIPVGKLASLLKSDYFTIDPAADITVDEIENVVSFVGAQLHLEDWLRRAERLTGFRLARPETEEPDQIDLPFDPAELNELQDVAGEEIAADDEPVTRTLVRADAVEKDDIRRAARVLAKLGRILLDIPFEASVDAMIDGFDRVLAALRFEEGLDRGVKRSQADPEKMLRATLDLRGRQAIGRALASVRDAVRFAAQGIALHSGDGAGTARSLPTLRITGFRDELNRSLDLQNLRVQPETFGTVRILEATDIRGLTFRAVFVVGLVEGGFPMRGRADWIYPPAEREALKEYGLTLEDISPAVMRKEEHYFYQVACRATERLYLSYPGADNAETETVPSYFLTEVGRCYGAGFFESSEANVLEISKGHDGQTFLEATTGREFARAATAVERLIRLGEPTENVVPASGSLSPEEVAETLGKHARKYVAPLSTVRIEVETARAGKSFGPYDGVLTGETTRGAVATQFGPERVFSATDFNEYGQCPFRFFAHRVLDLRPRVEAALDLQSQDRGLLLHAVLRDFFADLAGKPLTASTREALKARLERTAREVFEKFERRLPPLNPKLWEIERSVLMLQLERVLDYELDLEADLFQPPKARYTELAFGMKPMQADAASTSEPLKLTGEDGETLLLRGQIDRVDVSGDGKLLAYDYKSGRGAGMQDMREGRDVQLAIYLEAIDALFRREGEEIIGGGFYSLRAGGDRRNNGLYRREYSAYTGVGERTASNLSDEDWLALRRRMIDYVWEYRRRLRAGDFRVKPARNELTCRYCEYRAVCRFDRYRIQRKARV